MANEPALVGAHPAPVIPRPFAIALSIAAEIQAVTAAHPGGFLRDRDGPIHFNRQETSSNIPFRRDPQGSALL